MCTISISESCNCYVQEYIYSYSNFRRVYICFFFDSFCWLSNTCTVQINLFDWWLFNFNFRLYLLFDGWCFSVLVNHENGINTSAHAHARTRLFDVIMLCIETWAKNWWIQEKLQAKTQPNSTFNSLFQVYQNEMHTRTKVSARDVYQFIVGQLFLWKKKSQILEKREISKEQNFKNLTENTKIHEFLRMHTVDGQHREEKNW